MYELFDEASHFFYGIPPWSVSLIKIVVLLFALELGYWVGLTKHRSTSEQTPDSEGVILASTFALLGLIFAFTFSASVERYDQRKQEVIMEANAIGTAFLRADLIADPGRTEIKRTLLDYARLRIPPEEGKLGPDKQKELIKLPSEIISGLWPITMAAISRSPQSGAVEISLVNSVNEAIDQSAVRNAAVLDRLPAAILWMLVLISMFVMAEAGYKAGLSGRISRPRYIGFVMVLALVMAAIADYDRPQEGLIRVDQASMINTVSDMEAWFNSR